MHEHTLHICHSQIDVVNVSVLSCLIQYMIEESCTYRAQHNGYNTHSQYTDMHIPTPSLR